MDELYAGIGFGNLQPLGVVNLLTKDIRQQRANEQRKQQEKELLEDHKQIENPAKEAPRSGKNNDHILIAGIDNMMVRLSRCCNPIPGDQIVGYITKGRGVSIHRVDCPNVQVENENGSRLIDVSWNGLPSEHKLYDA